MTRKRSGKTLVQQLMRDCSNCRSLGHVPSLSTISHQLFEKCFVEVEKKNLSGTLLFVFSPDVFHYVVHNEYQAIVAIEAELGCRIILELDEDLPNESFRVEKADS